MMLQLAAVAERGIGVSGVGRMHALAMIRNGCGAVTADRSRVEVSGLNPRESRAAQLHAQRIQHAALRMEYRFGCEILVAQRDHPSRQPLGGGFLHSSCKPISLISLPRRVISDFT